MSATDLHPIFGLCCADSDGKYAISVPFGGHDGRWYATDGRICVRTIEPCGASERPISAPPAEDLFDITAGRLVPLVMPDDHSKCRDCHGSGTTNIAWKPCDECVDGGITCDCCWHESECSACDGRGVVMAACEPRLCRECRQTGVMPGTSVVARLDGVCLAPMYAALLLAHGVTEVLLIEGLRMVRFAHRDAGFEGMLMGCTDPSEGGAA